MKKEWIGKVGNTVYKIDISDADIFPQGFEFSLKLMDDTLWLDGYSKESLNKSLNDFGAFLTKLNDAYNHMMNFEWDEEKEKKYRAEMKAMRNRYTSVREPTENPPKKAKKAKKASGG